jgi:hypothetical protein
MHGRKRVMGARMAAPGLPAKRKIFTPERGRAVRWVKGAFCPRVGKKSGGQDVRGTQSSG